MICKTLAALVGTACNLVLIQGSSWNHSNLEKFQEKDDNMMPPCREMSWEVLNGKGKFAATLDFGPVYHRSGKEKGWAKNPSQAIVAQLGVNEKWSNEKDQYDAYDDWEKRKQVESREDQAATNKDDHKESRILGKQRRHDEKKKGRNDRLSKTRADPTEQLAGYETMHGRPAILPDVRLVYHESGRWKLLAGFQKEESREEMKKKDLHDTETVLSDRGKEMADTPSSGKNLLVPGNKLLQRTQTGHQRQLQRKSEGLADEDGTPSSQWYIAQLSELRLVYHESVRRKWVAKYQIDAP